MNVNIIPCRARVARMLDGIELAVALRTFAVLLLGAAVLAGLPADALAAEKPKLDTGDTAWMLTSTAIVLMMTIPGSYNFV